MSVAELRSGIGLVSVVFALGSLGIGGALLAYGAASNVEQFACCTVHACPTLTDTSAFPARNGAGVCLYSEATCPAGAGRMDSCRPGEMDLGKDCTVNLPQVSNCKGPHEDW
uniref:Uncharacterized protein n=1 Tax=Chromera velia CCMP2878 TaxID=1169474 RepID=A0A0G4FKB2_9ALVE|eukprot:Cvel_17476.t1-p1 / transcript=Cvel_17476.t1 / gene=Cvel_17476 / organism=Chromera_velia_CCMP2878 / gene_product=hypothetical protein / transcript_product=hypothetical protein / location=Cvel_scaffold1397:23770-24102(+) / protein_length=111 / sequence_SO=supercontig / SO=protein_coding / is_pseudo=false